MAAENSLYWPVPAIPPKGPQITLLGSSVAPPSSDDLNTAGAVQDAQKALANASSLTEIEEATAALAAAEEALDEEAANLAKQLGMLPAELRAELDINDNEKWIRGFGYFPEAHSAAINRAPGDTTTVDNPLLPANLPQVKVQPWDVGTKFTLSALPWNAEDFLGRAERQNDVAVASAIESEFWSGTLAKANGWPNNYLAGPRSVDITPVASAAATVTAASAPTLPLTVVAATNDTFIFTSANDPNTPDTFTVAPGTYTTLAALEAAVAAATSTHTPNLPFSTYVNVTGAGGKIVLTEIVRGTVGNSDTVTEGDGGAAAIGFSSVPAHFTGGGNATPVSVVEGLGKLQLYLARAGFGGQGMIHCTVEAAPNLLLTRRVGKFLLDEFDNYIVPGVGYPGTGPSTDAPAAGTTWMYATDMVATRIQRSTKIFPSTFAEALDRGQAGNPNTITFRAQRLAAAYFDGFVQAAILVDYTS